MNKQCHCGESYRKYGDDLCRCMKEVPQWSNTTLAEELEEEAKSWVGTGFAEKAQILQEAAIRLRTLKEKKTMGRLVRATPTRGPGHE